jgi:hypothetical protein
MLEHVTFVRQFNTADDQCGGAELAAYVSSDAGASVLDGCWATVGCAGINCRNSRFES